MLVVMVLINIIITNFPPKYLPFCVGLLVQLHYVPPHLSNYYFQVHFFCLFPFSTCKNHWKHLPSVQHFLWYYYNLEFCMDICGELCCIVMKLSCLNNGTVVFLCSIALFMSATYTFWLKMCSLPRFSINVMATSLLELACINKLHIH